MERFNVSTALKHVSDRRLSLVFIHVHVPSSKRLQIINGKNQSIKLRSYVIGSIKRCFFDQDYV